jgi:DNA-binding NarL/FixJ family response regulator
MNALNKIRIVLIEPSPVVRQGIKSLLEESAAGLSISEAYSDLEVFQESNSDTAFDIILINPALINFYKQFNVRNLFSDYPDTAIVAILYGYVDAKTLNSFDGALGIYDNGTTMVTKLQKVAKEFINQQNGSSADNAGLSEREKEILVAIAKGMTNKEIANKHYISTHTVISHRKNITRKTGIKTASGLTVYAMFNNLVSQEEIL